MITSTSWGDDTHTDESILFMKLPDVVSASRMPSQRDLAPATVYVVTAEDIKASGARDIWDVLRTVPGVDVFQSRTSQGDVSIRGLTSIPDNRTLVLLDGESARNPILDFVEWQNLPVTLNEIDRIEIVEGPASAIYGANAMSGVINIITKSAEQLHGGIMSYTGGERHTNDGSVVYGRQDEHMGYHVGGGWQSTNRFEDASLLASQVGKFDAALNYKMPNSEWHFSGGMTNHDSAFNSGALGVWPETQTTGFTRADYTYQNTRFHSYWNHGSELFQLPTGSTVLGSNPVRMDYNSYEASLEQTLSLPWNNHMAAGASYRRNTGHSSILNPVFVAQDLWAFYLEDHWDLAEHWSLNGSARVDRHPLTPIAFSPRGSLIYTPVPEHVFRVTAGTSFRNPTLIENYANISANFAVTDPNFNPPFTTIQINLLDNAHLLPERMDEEEVTYIGTFGRLKTNLTGFHYQLQNLIDTDIHQIVPLSSSMIGAEATFGNVQRREAWGGEIGGDLIAARWLTAFSNYSYQYIYDRTNQLEITQAPRHKANAGLRIKKWGFLGNLIVNWVDKTQFGGGSGLVPNNSYFLVNAHIGYSFNEGRLKGLEVGMNAFNLLNHDFSQVPPSPFGSLPVIGLQTGEILRQRLTGNVSYHF